MGLHSEESCYDDQAQRDHQYNCMSCLLALTQLQIKKKNPPKKKNTHFYYLLEDDKHRNK